MLDVRGFARIANDPYLMNVGSTVKVTFSIVTEEKRKIRDTEDVVKTPHYVLVEAWGTAAEFLHENALRGDLIYIDGHLKEEEREINGVLCKRHFIRLNNFRVFEN